MATVEDYLNDPLTTEAERRLIEACRKGMACKLGPLPPETGEAPTVRAEVIRCLALEVTSLHEAGVWLEGARITGQLDLRFAKCRGSLILARCRFVQVVNLKHAEIPELSLDKSYLIGLRGQSMKISGSLFLSNSRATGTIDINQAKIGDQLACVNCNINGGELALSAQAIEVSGSMFLRGAVTIGTIDLNAAIIGGQLDCSGLTIRGSKKTALNCQSMQVKKGFVFFDVICESGTLNMTSASITDLVDDLSSWMQSSLTVLDGFNYRQLTGNQSAAKNFASRKAWLENGSNFKGEFFPQPYTQFAKVMRASGHLREARKTLMERERLLARANRLAAYKRPEDERYLFPLENPLADLRYALRWTWDSLLRLCAGYGFAPLRTVTAMALLICAAWFAADRTWDEGSFAPNSDVILVSPGWQALLERDCLPDPTLQDCVKNPANVWSSDPDNGLDWDSFHALGYAADLVIPVLDLGQTSAWAPSKDRGAWGHWLWWARWVFVAFGWTLTAMGAAAVTGIMQRNDPE